MFVPFNVGKIANTSLTFSLTIILTKKLIMGIRAYGIALMNI